jgi:hypothetical protein
MIARLPAFFIFLLILYKLSVSMEIILNNTILNLKNHLNFKYILNSEKVSFGISIY